MVFNAFSMVFLGFSTVFLGFCMVLRRTPQGLRYFRVEGHLHLGLGLTLRKVYGGSELRRRCGGDESKLKRLEEPRGDRKHMKTSKITT